MGAILTYLLPTTELAFSCLKKVTPPVGASDFVGGGDDFLHESQESW
jgi:hypothetical protein